MGAQRAGAPVLTGSVPPLAPFYHARQETGFGLNDGLRAGETTLLVPALPGTGGTGKTQLALGFAHTVWSARAVDLLAWVPAGNRSAIIAGYARAAADLDLLAGEETAGTADSAAQRFLGWLRKTERRWVVVLDGVVSPVDVDGLWPRGPSGQVVVTSRLRESELGRGPGAEVNAHSVAGFSRREALGYLNARLTSFPDQRIEALDLAEDLGGLPIALAQAGAVVTANDMTCREYRSKYAQRLGTITDTVIDGCPQSLLATWSLAVELAHELPPAGLSWPALVFAAAFDTNGIPAAVLTSPAACGYIAAQFRAGHDVRPHGTGQHSAGQYSVGQSAAEQNMVRSAYANLERLGLLSLDSGNPARTVWLHSAVRAAVRAYLAAGNVEQVVTAAAAALVEAWPDPGAPGHSPQLGQALLSQALRDCAAALRAFAGDLLWKPDAHPVLLRAGTSLTEPPALADSAIGYWQAVGAASSQLLGYGHAQSVLARDRLADAYAIAGRLAEALPVFEATLADREAALGPQHPDTVAARLSTARSLRAAGREPEAIALYEQVLAARERMVGPGHPETLGVRAQLAEAYEAAGRRGESIQLYERALADAERDLGPMHDDTLSARASLAAAYLSAGRTRQAISAYERALADQERATGTDSPSALSARASLAAAYRAAGKHKEAVAGYERLLADRERLLGPDHPDTIGARGSLGYAYRTAGRLKDALPHYERVVADRERLFGPDQRETLAARAILGAAYQQGRRLREAIEAYESVVADSERVLGPGDVDTLTSRCNLAMAYYDAHRMADGVKMLRHALADCERYLGPSHALTTTVRDNIAAATELRTPRPLARTAQVQSRKQATERSSHAHAVRLHHRRRRLRGLRARGTTLRGPDHPRARARGGTARLQLGPVHPHARRPDVPDRIAVLRLAVLLRARAVPERAAHLPRARQGARRVVVDQRDDLPARQPA
jgi:tetratricopeptide (TPR) repeat protein